MTVPTEDPPTDALPVVPAEDPLGRYTDSRADDLVDEEWSEPRRRSRMTTVLVVLLLVAIGFLAGVYVGRAGGAATATERGGGAAATSTARPGGAGGARAGGGGFRAF